MIGKRLSTLNHPLSTSCRPGAIAAEGAEGGGSEEEGERGGLGDAADGDVHGGLVGIVAAVVPEDEIDEAAAGQRGGEVEGDVVARGEGALEGGSALVEDLEGDAIAHDAEIDKVPGNGGRAELGGAGCPAHDEKGEGASHLAGVEGKLIGGGSAFRGSDDELSVADGGEIQNLAGGGVGVRVSNGIGGGGIDQRRGGGSDGGTGAGEKGPMAAADGVGDVGGRPVHVAVGVVVRAEIRDDGGLRGGGDQEKRQGEGCGLVGRFHGWNGWNLEDRDPQRDPNAGFRTSLFAPLGWQTTGWDVPC